MSRAHNHIFCCVHRANLIKSIICQTWHNQFGNRIDENALLKLEVIITLPPPTDIGHPPLDALPSTSDPTDNNIVFRRTWRCSNAGLCFGFCLIFSYTCVSAKCTCAIACEWARLRAATIPLTAALSFLSFLDEGLSQWIIYSTRNHSPKSGMKYYSLLREGMCARAPIDYGFFHFFSHTYNNENLKIWNVKNRTSTNRKQRATYKLVHPRCLLPVWRNGYQLSTAKPTHDYRN